MKKFIIVMILGLSLASTAFAQTTSNVNTNSNSNSKVTTDADTKTFVISPPASAIAPSVNSSNSDLCTVGVAGAVQTQILGISSGETVRDPNCERLKLSKTLYDMGMKVAAVSVLCQDRRVFDAMSMAGTPCPFLGEIGQAAQTKWEENPKMLPPPVVLETKDDVQKKQGIIAGAGVGLGVLLLLLL
jgi:hypothetical protein|tara:strand:- start:1524 stop:2084 length:561 start_codon:yes stop_codon:yes gene_type:complete